MATTGARVTTGTVAAAGEEENDEHEDHDEGDDPKQLHPKWCEGGRSAVGYVAGVGVGHVSHVRLLRSQVVAE